MPGGERRTETKLGEVVGSTFRCGEREKCNITMVPPFALGWVRGSSMSWTDILRVQIGFIIA